MLSLKSGRARRHAYWPFSVHLHRVLLYVVRLDVRVHLGVAIARSLELSLKSSAHFLEGLAFFLQLRALCLPLVPLFLHVLKRVLELVVLLPELQMVSKWSQQP